MSLYYDCLLLFPCHGFLAFLFMFLVPLGAARMTFMPGNSCAVFKVLDNQCLQTWKTSSARVQPLMTGPWLGLLKAIEQNIKSSRIHMALFTKTWLHT